MKTTTLVALLAGLTFPVATSAERPGELSLSLTEALRYAAEHSPRVAEGDARVGLTDAAIEQASIATPFDPTVEVGAGPRFGPTQTTANLEVAVGQKFELGGRRRAAIRLAQEDRRVAEHRAGDVQREQLYAVGVAYVRALHARRRLQVSRAETEIARTAVEIAGKRFQAGETDRLEVNTAKVAHGRSTVEERLWTGRLDDRLARLRSLLGVPDRTRIALTSTLELPPVASVEVLLERAQQRSDVAALRAVLDREQARDALASALTRPDLGVRLAYGREEGADVLMAALSLSLPVFARGRGVRAEAGARGEVARASLDVVRTTIAERLPAARGRWQQLRDAEVAFRNDVLPFLKKNEEMAQKAYRAGAIDLPELLALRREMVAARERYADLLLESAMVRLEVNQLVGTLGGGETR
jgi:cobalt-zinc-cadmium efflux system outer membrane protein